ncbi:hypothetical protein AJ79_09560 [Helicocarpus griseus UAMH5409]|uniref:Tat pathway signal sequence n=1 Tax=Helicocarpus griseus UAMH5409 TaxID=1447875 RepID=A0A2B7WJ08_9EURO|nr:hypothetical protein AJ79_09560 [Helicocarpus griseus UAMH5409]
MASAHSDTRGKFERISPESSQSIKEEEEHLLPDGEKRLFSRKGKRKCAWQVSAKALTVLNILLMAILLAAWAASSATMRRGLADIGPNPPFSPVRDDGYVRYVNRRFRPTKIFQSETSDEVEAAWSKILGVTDGVVQLPKSIASKLDESIESFVEPGQYIYGVGMLHQMHCLNRIRRSFYPKKFFPNETQEQINVHKNHCFDLLRQSILCAGDVSMVYWWNRSYSYTDEQGQRHHTQKFLTMSNEEKTKGSFAFWDVEAHCRDWDKIYEWAEINQVHTGVTGALFGNSTGDS